VREEEEESAKGREGESEKRPSRPPPCAHVEQIVLFNCLYFNHKTPDSGERRCKIKDLEKSV